MKDAQISVSINQSIVCFVIAIHGNWIPANPRFALPAGMTDFLVLGELFCCSVSRLKLVAHYFMLIPKALLPSGTARQFRPSQNHFRFVKKHRYCRKV